MGLLARAGGPRQEGAERAHHGSVTDDGAAEPGEIVPARVSVGGTDYLVREATAADADLLLDLYRRLSADDLHRRFFSGFRPSHEFVERWIAQSERGGAVLIVVAGTDGASVVADAGYVPTRPGVAELAMTVSPDHRGWLGPYLLDLLVEHARRHGFVTLEAEVLTSNCSMLAVLRARGCAFEPSDDMSVAKVLIGTEGAAPAWPPDAGHPRVLVEGSSAGWPGVARASEGEMSVIVCPGPERGRMRPCPLLQGDHCPLVDGADAVVVALPRSARSAGPLLAAHARDHPGTPIAVTRRLHDVHGDVPGRPTEVVDPDISAQDAAGAIRRATSSVDDDQGSRADT